MTGNLSRRGIEQSDFQFRFARIEANVYIYIAINSKIGYKLRDSNEGRRL